MEINDILTNELTFRWDESSRKLLVLDADPKHSPKIITQIEYDTLNKMSWPDASKFIGEFVTLLVPELRSMYSSEFADAKESANDNFTLDL
jgi:hypothetical protein